MERGFDVCSPRGGRHSRKSNWSMATIFLSTPSARRATLCRWAADHRWRISIHALREEGDATARDTTCRRMNFYPRPPRGGRQSSPYIWMMVLTFLSTPSVRRATITLSEFFAKAEDFYPRPPRGGRHATAAPTAKSSNFYPRPPRGGRQGSNTVTINVTAISIHALREEGDRSGQHYTSRRHRFLSTPSARRATPRKRRRTDGKR